jgi:hypothetical protein
MLMLISTTKSTFRTADAENIIQALSEPALCRLKKLIHLLRFERTVPTLLSPSLGPCAKLHWAKLALFQDNARHAVILHDYTAEVSYMHSHARGWRRSG